MDKKSPLQTVKHVVEKKQVETRIVYGSVSIATGSAAVVPISQYIDIPFSVGKIVCEHVSWASDAELNITRRMSFVVSDLFGGQPICSVGDAFTAYYQDGGADVRPNSSFGLNQIFSNAEIVFKEPKKVRGTYKFPMINISGNEETEREGQLAILLKFYEY